MSKKLIKRSKKEVHAQSAMEYLLTYGWSILIIAIALVTLFELGYFNGINSTLPSECIPQIGFLCNNLQLNSTGNLTLTVGNNGGENLVITGLGCSNSSSTPTTFSPVLLTLGQGQSKQVTFECQLNSQNIGSSFKGSLWMQLNNGQEEELGSTSATVSTGSPTGVPGSNGQGIIYLSNDYAGSSSLIKLNLVTGNILNNIILGQGIMNNPDLIAENNQNMYIVNYNGGPSQSGNLIIYNTQTNQFSSIDSPLFDKPFGISFYGSNAYITNQEGGEFNTGNLIIYNTQTNQFSSIDSPFFYYPKGISFYGSNAYILSNAGLGQSGNVIPLNNELGESGNIIIYNTKTNQFSSINSQLLNNPSGIAFYGYNGYITNLLASNLIIYNTQTNQFSSINSQMSYFSSGISFYGANAYISNLYGGEYNSGNLIIYNTQTNQFSSVDSQSFVNPTGITFYDSNAYITNGNGGLLGTGNTIILNPSNNYITGSLHFSNNNMLYNPIGIFLNGTSGYFIGKQYKSYAFFTINLINNIINRYSSDTNYIGSPTGLVFYNNNSYVVNENNGEYGTGNLIIYNSQTNQFSSLDSPLFKYPVGIAISGSNLYIANSRGTDILLYNTQTNQLSQIDSSLLFYPYGILSYNQNEYITNEFGGQYGAGNIIIYNTQNNQFSSFDSPDFKNPTYITKSGSDIYIYNSGNILVFNPSQEAIVNSISTLSASNYLIDGMSNT